MNRPRFAFALALLVAAVAAPRASHAEGKSVRESLVRDAAEKFDEGSRRYKAKDYEGARATFLSAYDSSRDARILFNVAVCDKALGRYARAIETLRTSLASGGASLPAEYVERTSTAIATLSRYTATLAFDSPLSGTSFYVDDELARDGTAAADPGTHLVRASKEGYDDASLSITVEKGEKRRVELSPTPAKPGVVSAHCLGAPGCEIEIGEEALGRAPVTFSRGAGSYVVRAKVRGRFFGERSFSLKSGQALALEIEGRLPPIAHLRVTTDGPNDLIRIDGKRAGEGGQDLEVDPGEHRIQIVRNGEIARSLDVFLKDAETRDLRVDLRDKESRGISAWWFVGGGVIVAGAATLAVVLLSQPTKFEGNTAGTLNPYVVPASRGVFR